MHSPENQNVLYPKLVVTWAAMLASVLLYFGVIEFLKPASGAASGETNGMLQTALLGIAIGLVGASFPIRNQLLAKARVAGQQEHLRSLTDPESLPEQIRSRSLSPAQGLRFSALLIPLAMCEASGVLGVVVYFLSGSPRYMLFLAVSVAGMLLHFPRREPA